VVKVFLDSARPGEIEAAVARGCVAGVTTNPTFLREEAGARPLAHLRRVVALLRPHGLPLSVQVMTTVPGEMVRQAEMIRDELDYEGLVIKVPCGWDELAVIAELSSRGVSVNGTACMSATQALMAAGAGASYVTLFYGKMSDAGIDAGAVVEDVAGALRGPGAACQLVVASIRRTYDVHECLRRGAHVATVAFRLLPGLCEHPKTAEAVRGFAESFVPLDVAGSAVLPGAVRPER
jgi:transaldolase